MLSIRKKEDGFELGFFRGEIEILRTLPEQLRGIIEDPDFTRKAARRLFPPASGDPEVQLDYMEFAADDIRARKLENLDGFAETLTESRIHYWLGSPNRFNRPKPNRRALNRVQRIRNGNRRSPRPIKRGTLQPWNPKNRLRAGQRILKGGPTLPRLMVLSLSGEEFEYWLGFLNDMRLMLGTEIGVDSGDWENRIDWDTVEDVQVEMYGFLSYLQSALLDALT